MGNTCVAFSQLLVIKDSEVSCFEVEFDGIEYDEVSWFEVEFEGKFQLNGEQTPFNEILFPSKWKRLASMQDFLYTHQVHWKTGMC